MNALRVRGKEPPLPTIQAFQRAAAYPRTGVTAQQELALQYTVQRAQPAGDEVSARRREEPEAHRKAQQLRWSNLPDAC